MEIYTHQTMPNRKTADTTKIEKKCLPNFNHKSRSQKVLCQKLD
jgi:hypothetical protein